mmetsp:Transcript_108274/g.170731  ORF Transcript_108274/g.170731 Transcript_108274/m.170731 type:complete len:274 (-) Transcript_108274:190-1011(-)
MPNSRNGEDRPLRASPQKGGGSFLASILCGNECCRKDARPETDMVMPTDAPTVYTKANEPDSTDVKAPQSAKIKDANCDDPFIQAEDVDSEKKPCDRGKPHPRTKSKDSKASKASKRSRARSEAGEESDYYEDEESEEEEGEESEEEPPEDVEFKEHQRDHAKSIQALKASFEPIKANLEANASPRWKPPEARGGDQDDDEEPEAPPRPTAKRREIEALKQSLPPVGGVKKDRQDQLPKSSMTTQPDRGDRTSKTTMQGKRDKKAGRRCCSIQ